jgi:hypothetical protein
MQRPSSALAADAGIHATDARRPERDLMVKEGHAKVDEAGEFVESMANRLGGEHSRIKRTQYEAEGYECHPSFLTPDYLTTSEWTAKKH